MRKRTLVVGDVHGMYDRLMKSLEYAVYNDADRLIFLGDYINRGRHSRDVLDFLIQVARNPANVFLKGNHEEMILKLFAGQTEYWYTWIDYAGGGACMRSYGKDPNHIRPDGEGYVLRNGKRHVALSDPDATTQFIAELFPREHLDFMMSTVVMHETDRFYFCHAGIESGVPLKAQKAYADCFMTWGDNVFIKDETGYEKVVIFGHYHLKEPLIRRNRACIALKDSVGVLDLENRVVYDSKGNRATFQVSIWP